MGFFNIEKENDNKQNTFFNQNPNMMGNNQYDDSYNNQGMMNQQPMMNQGMMQNDMNYNQFPNNGMMQQDYNQGMMGNDYNQNMMGNNFNQGMMQQNYNQGMIGTDYNQGMMGSNQYNDGYSNQGMMNTNYNQNMAPDSNYNQYDNNMNYNQSEQQGVIFNQPTSIEANPEPVGHDNIDIPILGNQNNQDNQPSSTISPSVSLANNDLNNNPSGDMSLYNEPSTNTGGELSLYNEGKNESNNQNAPLNNESSLPKEGSDIKPEDNKEKASVPEEEGNLPEVPDKENHEDIESLEEPQLPREIEKEMELAGTNVSKEEKTEEKVPVDAKPEDNGINSIPVNPIIAEIDKHQDVEEIGETKDVKANVFAAMGIILGMIVRPGTTMIKNSKRFNKMNKAFSIMLWLSLLFLVICIVVRVAVGSFDRQFSSLTDSYNLSFNPGRIFELSNYLEFILISVSLSIGGVLLVALIYYASSFLNGKGVHFATYLIVSNLGMIPVIVGSIVLYPAAMIVSNILAVGVLIFTFLATLITILIGMNGVLKFKSVNNQIFYHVINLSFITLIAILVFIFMVHNNWVILPRMNI